MVTGDFKAQVDSLWQAFWSGGVSNPLSVIEQITYLLFIRRLDQIQTREESKAQMLGTTPTRIIFPEGNYVEDVADPDDPKKKITVSYQDLRWKFLRDKAPEEAFKIMDNFVFQFLQNEVAAKGSCWYH